MAITNNQDLLFASIMGIDNIATLERLSIVENDLQKRVFPDIPFIPFRNKVVVDGLSSDPTWLVGKADLPTPENQQFFPLSFSFTETGQKWLFPYEPMININSGNSIIKRNVAKQGNELIGTVKERWSRKDFEIQVTGVLIGSMLSGKVDDCFPRQDMERLFEFLKYSKEFFIYCYPLEVLGITKVVVEDYSFPFTKGENVQAYDLKLVSDFSYNLLVPEETF